MLSSRFGARRLPCLAALCAIFPPEPLRSQDGYEWLIEYLDAQRRVEILDPAGQRTTYQYAFDASQRLKEVIAIYPDGSRVTWQLDENGRLSSLEDTEGRTAWRYDPWGRPVSVTRSGEAPVQMEWNGQDRPTSIRVGDWKQTLEYDSAGELRVLESPAGTYRFRRDPERRRFMRQMGDLQSTWEYNADGSLAALAHHWGDRPIVEFQYAYGDDGLLSATRELDSGSDPVVDHWSFDGLGRVIAVGGARYGYDAMGNRTTAIRPSGQSSSSVFDPSGRLAHHGGDPAGTNSFGAVSTLAGFGTQRSFGYTPTYRLSHVDLGSSRVTYSRDGNGLLLSRSYEGRVTRFTPSPLSRSWQPLVIANDDSEEFIVWMGSTPLAAVSSSGETVFLLEDGMGSVRRVLSASGRVRSKPSYDPFGLPDVAAFGSGLWPAAAGHMYDAAAGLYPGGASAYDPHIGQPLQPHTMSQAMAAAPQAPWALLSGATWSLPDVEGRMAGMAETAIKTAAEVLLGKEEYDAFKHGWTIGKVLDSGPKFFESPTVTDGLKLWSKIAKLGDMKLAADVASNAATILDARKRMEDQPGPAALLLAVADAFDVVGRKELARIVRSGAEFGLTLRSAVLHNRALSLIELPYGVRKHLDTVVRHDVGDYRGSASMRARDFAAQVKWEIRDSLWTPRSPIQARYSLRNDLTARGSLVSGSFFATETREVTSSGGYRRETRRSSRTRETFNGAAVNRAIAAYERSGNPADYRRTLFEEYGVSSPSRGRVPPLPARDPAIDVEVDPIELERDDDEVYDSLEYPFLWDPRRLDPVPIGRDPFDGGPPPAGAAPFEPSRLGGISLSGAGAHLGGLGELQGLVLDEASGRIVLLSKKGEVAVPPLRIPALVTVFRTVYHHGVSPSVSIDPVRAAPRGPLMNVLHGPGTNQTYVGWVLYESDRWLKALTLGQDNRPPQNKVAIPVAGYANLLDRRVAGGTSGGWERFEIQIAKVIRNRAPGRNLTLLDVPLMLETESMRLANGVLVSAARGSSPSALAFAAWFDKSYDAISKHIVAVPPKESGVAGPVELLQELRAIALIAAIAETLRDQGVPFPTWMRDYPVPECPVDPTTPSITVEKRGAGVIHRIFGGVDLTPRAAQIERTSEEPAGADQLRNSVAAVLRRANDFDVANIDSPLVDAVAVIPGDEVRSVGAFRLDEVDLEIPIDGRAPLRLARTFHSFFRPHGLFGTGWTARLPRLATRRYPVRTESDGRDLDAVSEVLELSTPHGEINALFRERAMIEGFTGPLWVTTQADEIVGIGGARRPEIAQQTHTVFFADGREWHFDTRGNFVANVSGQETDVYRRREDGQITSIEGWVRGRLMAQVDLEYGEVAGEPRLIEARSARHNVQYEYDGDGYLTAVSAPDTRVRYACLDDRISRIERGEDVLGLVYDDRGRLVVEEDAGQYWTYAYEKTVEGGHRVTRTRLGDETPTETVTYDAGNRRTMHVRDDGSVIRWRRSAGGTIETRFGTDGTLFELQSSAGGRRVELRSDSQPPVVFEFDDVGRPILASEGDRELVRWTWDRDGRMQSASLEQGLLRPQYDARGDLQSVEFESRGTNPEVTRLELDEQRRPSRVVAGDGSVVVLGYDEESALVSVTSNRDTVRISLDSEQRTESVSTSWGYREDVKYDSRDQVASITHSRNGVDSIVEAENGRPVRVTDAHGRVNEFKYEDDGPAAGAIRELVLADGTHLRVDYDNRRRAVTVRDTSGAARRSVHDERGRVVSVGSLREINPPTLLGDAIRRLGTFVRRSALYRRLVNGAGF